MNNLVNLYNAGLELTMACPCRCETCGSDAGRARAGELTVAEWVKVIRDLADLGCGRLTFLGGEPLLVKSWPVLVRTARQSGIYPDLITSGVTVDEALARRLADSGLVSVTVSVDGTAAVHDAQRKLDGCHAKAMEAIRLLDVAGMKVGVTTQVNSENLPTLEPMAPMLQQAGAMGWQLQLTLPAGRAEHRPDLIIQPSMMGEVHDVIRRLVSRPGLRPFVTDNIGWLTPDDPVLRTPTGAPERCWLGCMAGLRAVGITSDGGVKGCLSLPDSMIEGNVRSESLADIWNDPDRFSYNRAFDPATLSGGCADCEFARVCRGGCTATAMAVHGRTGASTHCLRLNADG